MLRIALLLLGLLIAATLLLLRCVDHDHRQAAPHGTLQASERFREAVDEVATRCLRTLKFFTGL